jgi:hypothetical protein
MLLPRLPQDDPPAQALLPLQGQGEVQTLSTVHCHRAQGKAYNRVHEERRVIG